MDCQSLELKYVLTCEVTQGWRNCGDATMLGGSSGNRLDKKLRVGIPKNTHKNTSHFFHTCWTVKTLQEQDF